MFADSSARTTAPAIFNPPAVPQRAAADAGHSAPRELHAITRSMAPYSAQPIDLHNSRRISSYSSCLTLVLISRRIISSTSGK